MGSTQDHTAYCRPSFLGADPWSIVRFARRLRWMVLVDFQTLNNGPGISPCRWWWMCLGWSLLLAGFKDGIA